MFEILGSLLALAIGAGFVGALSGLGGGVFIVPALVVGAHMPMTVAIGASLISVVATSAGASVAFVRDGWTNLKVAMVLEVRDGHRRGDGSLSGRRRPDRDPRIDVRC